MDKKTHNHSTQQDASQRSAISEADALAMVENVVLAADVARLRAVVEQNPRCARDVAIYQNDRALIRSTPVPVVSDSTIRSAIHRALSDGPASSMATLDFGLTRLTTLQDMQPKTPWHARPMVRRFGALAAMIAIAGGAVALYESVRDRFVPAAKPTAADRVLHRNTAPNAQGGESIASHSTDTHKIDTRSHKTGSPTVARNSPPVAPIIAGPDGITVGSTTPHPPLVPMSRALELARERKLIVMLESHQPTSLADRLSTLLTPAHEGTGGTWSLTLHDEARSPGALAAIEIADLHVSTRLGINTYASDHAPRVFTDINASAIVASEPAQLIYTLECALTEGAMAEAIAQLARAGTHTDTGDPSSQVRSVEHRVVFVELPEPMPASPKPSSADTVLWWTAPAEVWEAGFAWAEIPVIIGRMDTTGK